MNAIRPIVRPVPSKSDVYAAGIEGALKYLHSIRHPTDYERGLIAGLEMAARLS